MKPYEKDGKWLVKYWWRNQPHYSKPFDSEQEAQVFCDSVALDLKAAKRSNAVPHIIAEAPKQPTAETATRSATSERFIQEYTVDVSPDLDPKSTAQYGYAWKSLTDLCPIRHVAEVTPALIQTFKARAKESGLAPASVATKIKHLRVIFNWGVANHYIAESPFSKKSKRDTDSVVNDPKQYLTIEELENLIQCAAEHGQDIHWFVMLCGLAGLRRNEALNARWEWVNLGGAFMREGGSITVQSGIKFKPKSRQARTISLHQTLKTHLSLHLQDSGYIIKPEITQWTTFRWDYRKQFQSVLKAAGLEQVDRYGRGKENVSAHTLRHTFASMLAQNGYTTFEIMQLCGHSDERVSQGYMHLAPTKKALTFGTRQPSGRVMQIQQG